MFRSTLIPPFACQPSKVVGCALRTFLHIASTVNPLREKLRHKLEYRTITQSKERSTTERADRKRQHCRPLEQQRKQGNSRKHSSQHTRAANAFREPSPCRTQKCCEHNKTSRAKSGICDTQTELMTVAG